MKVRLSEDAIMPRRAHTTDAGLDLFTPKEVTILPYSSAIINTGVGVELPHGCAGLLVSKSGLNVVKDVTNTGLIDEGYSGNIIIKLYNQGPNRIFLPKNKAVAQLVVIPVRYEPVEIALDIGGGDRGTDGLGSTDKEATKNEG